MSRVLLLNNGFQALSTVNVRRALALVMSGRAESVVHKEGAVVRTVTVTLPVPSVIRLKTYVSVPQRRVSWSRRGVLIRDRYVCQYCSHKLIGHDDQTVDHIIPRTAFENPREASTWSNTSACCRKCQKRKGDRSIHAAGMRFFDPKFEPKTPRVNYLVITHGEAEKEWKEYIQF